MKLLFNVEQYEDMKDHPFVVERFFKNRLYIYCIDNETKKLLFNSTFHDALLLDIAEGLIHLFENTTEKFLVETYENDLEFTFKKQDKWLAIECFSEYDSSNEKYPYLYF